MSLRVLDLFSGIGGFSLGLERTGGFETVAFCEIDPYCRKVLAKHWPEVSAMTTSEPLLPLDLPQTELFPMPRTAERRRRCGAMRATICGRASGRETLRQAIVTGWHRCHLRRLPLPGHQRRRKGRGHWRRAQRPMVRVRPNYWRGTTPLRHRGERRSSAWIGDLSVFSETWPRSGMMRSGTAYQLPPLVPLTDATGSGSWPTPDAERQRDRWRTSTTGSRRTASQWHEVQVDRRKPWRMWPTPTSTGD